MTLIRIKQISHAEAGKQNNESKNFTEENNSGVERSERLDKSSSVDLKRDTSFQSEQILQMLGTNNYHIS